jgi:glycerol-3-phosphate dehydrogenase
MYARDPELVEMINSNHYNPHYLSEFELSGLISASTSVDDVLEGVSFAILALPTQLIPKWLAEHKHQIRSDLLLCNTAKGLYLEENCLLSEAIERVLQREQPYAILSGPSFAEEMMRNNPTAGPEQ